MHASRRTFLKLGGVALAASTLPGWAFGETARAGGLQLGYSLYGMKTMTVPEAITTCAGLGFASVEICLNPGFASEPDRFSAVDRAQTKAALAQTGIAVSSYMRDMPIFGLTANQRDNLEAIRRAADLARAVAPGREALIESVLGGSPADWAGGKERAADYLRQWGETAQTEGVIVAVKGHAGGAVRLPEQLRWLLQKANHPAIAVNFDQSHYQLEGVSLTESLAALGPYIRLTHIKDSSGNGQKFRFLLPGEGHTDFVAYFRALRAVGYNGALVTEVSAQIFNHPGFDPKATAARCFEVLSPAVQAANQT